MSQSPNASAVSPTCIAHTTQCHSLGHGCLLGIGIVHYCFTLDAIIRDAGGVPILGSRARLTTVPRLLNHMNTGARRESSVIVVLAHTARTPLPLTVLLGADAQLLQSWTRLTTVPRFPENLTSPHGSEGAVTLRLTHISRPVPLRNLTILGSANWSLALPLGLGGTLKSTIFSTLQWKTFVHLVKARVSFYTFIL